MGDLPQKVICAPAEDSPLPNIYKRLTEVNALYPITDINAIGTYLPDFTGAVEMTHAIYRVNVPGFFYRCPGTGGSFDTTHRAGIVIGSFNYLMNSVQDDGLAKLYTGDGKSGGTVCHEYVVREYLGYLVSNKDNKYGDGLGHQVKTNGDIYKGTTPNTYAPKTMIGGVACYGSVRANQRECPEKFPGTNQEFTRDRALNYVVCAGQSGGIANCLVPIIPGMATTAEPEALKYDNGALVTYCCSPTEGWSYYTPPGKTETNWSAITFISNIGNTYWCVEQCLIPKGELAGQLGVRAVLEAKGTYVYFYRESECTDKFYFIPAKDGPRDIQPITKIRDITNPSSCTYQIPAADTYIESTSSVCSALYHGSAYYEIGTQENGTARASLKNSKGDVKYTISHDVGGCKINAHSQPFCDDFCEIFKNSKIAGHKDKFIAQVLTLLAYAGKTSGDYSTAIGHAMHTLFDPRATS